MFLKPFVYSFCMAALFGCRWLLMLHRKPLADQNCSAIINNHLPTIENHPEKRVVVGGRREVVDVILWQPVTDHRQTFADLRQPPATTPKIVVVRGRRLVVAIVWPSLKVEKTYRYVARKRRTFRRMHVRSKRLGKNEYWDDIGTQYEGGILRAGTNLTKSGEQSINWGYSMGYWGGVDE